MQRCEPLRTSFAQFDEGAHRNQCFSSTAASIPEGGAKTYIQNAVQRPETAAEPKLRAGFMLKPESGDSNEMKRKTSAATKAPVNFVVAGNAAVTRIVSIATKATTNSATSATTAPCAPGRVTIHSVGGSRNIDPSNSPTIDMPARPPMTWNAK
jgi:hypothetical protein